MARLSQRAMNNVVIFAMLIMIALFNLDAFLPKKARPLVTPLIPEDAYVLKIEQGQSQLVRNGQGWRQITPDGELENTPAEQIAAWRQASLTMLPDAPQPSGEPLVVVVWLAGQSDGEVLAFYPQSTAVLVKKQQQWYSLSNTSLTALLPWSH